jgi:hypothetical protein
LDALLQSFCCIIITVQEYHFTLQIVVSFHFYVCSKLAIETVIQKQISCDFRSLQPSPSILCKVALEMEFAELIKVPVVEKVQLFQPHCEPTEGTLCITTHYLIFSSRKAAKDELWVS